MERLMELEEYAEHIRKAVKASLPDHLAESKVSIVYGKYWYAHLEIELPWSDTPVCFQLTFDYREYLSMERSPEFTTAEILNNPKLYPGPIDFPHMDTTDFAHVKSRIVARIISSRPQNEKVLKDRPVKYLDGPKLAVVWEFLSPFLCYDKDERIARKPVTYDMLDEWGVSITELEKIAMKNTQLLRPAKVKYMNLQSEEKETEEDYQTKEDCKTDKIVVVTNQGEIDGATVLTYLGMREKLTGMIGRDVAIIPFSIHKCFAVAKEKLDSYMPNNLICDVEKPGVGTSDFLSDGILEYTPDGRLIPVICNQENKPPIDENSIFI